MVYVVCIINFQNKTKASKKFLSLLSNIIQRMHYDYIHSLEMSPQDVWSNQQYFTIHPDTGNKHFIHDLFS